MLNIIETHVSIAVADLEEAKQYLEKICGLTKCREVKKPDRTISWYPGLELWQAEDGETPGVVKHVAWRVDDIDAAIQTLKSTGVTFDEEQPGTIDPTYLDTKEVVRYVFFSTPLGFQGELYQVDPPAGD